MNRMNPITVSNEIRDTYFRYIMTRFPLGKSNHELREQLKKLLYSDEGKNRLIKGPILEIMPPYKKGWSLKELSIRFPVWKPLANHIENHFGKEDNFNVETKLFFHQQEALIKSLENNIVISSGTGSGKTECFLFPIFQFCLDHPGEGVRAILIYPLNALVEDQIDRLSRYLRGTNVTFGKYTGQTPRTGKDAEKVGEKKRCPNHMITREEMRSNPPNILVTNYTMLEYMSIRPGDSPILDKRDGYSFRFIVLDEVHTYSGAVGTEVAYLLKRLRHRVGRKTDDIRYISTSATLGAGEDIIDKTVTFVKRLFGADFSKDCIIREAKQDLSEYLPKESENDYNLETIIDWRLPGPGITPGDVKQKLGIETDEQNLRLDIYSKLMKNNYVKEIIFALTDGPKPVDELAEKLFPGKENAVNAIVNLVAWADFAKKDSGLSLLPARYHMFVSAAKGIFCELAPSGSAKLWKHLALSQQDISEKEKEAKPYPFELGVCKVCGEPYIMGVFVRDDSGIKYKPIADSFFETIDSEDKESYKVILHPKQSLNSKAVKICRRCGSVGSNCEHLEPEKVVLFILDTSQTFYNDLVDEITENDPEETEKTDREGNKQKGCINCGYGRDLSKCVIPMRFPANGSTAPLVSTLFTQCPGMDRDTIVKNESEILEEFKLTKRNRNWTPVIANGKKMLIFSDSRQEAAFFGPYMQITHNQMVFNRFMIDILRNKKSSINIKDWKGFAKDKLLLIEDNRDRNKLAALLKQLRPGDKFLNELIDNYTLRMHRIYSSIFHLIDNTASSISGLEGIGIAAVYFNSPQFAEEVDLPGFSKIQILALAQLILRYIRLNEAFYPSPEENIILYSSFDAYFKSHPPKVLLLSKEDEAKGESIIRLISRQKKPTRLQTMIRSCIRQLFLKMKKYSPVISMPLFFRIS